MGNTNAWAKVVGLLLEDDDYILCEEFTYPSSQAYWIPLGNHAAPIPLDAEGMRADLLEDRLANWESTHPGKRRPHVLYVVPVGSNPSGITYSVERKKALYEVCVKYGKTLTIKNKSMGRFWRNIAADADAEKNKTQTLSLSRTTPITFYNSLLPAPLARQNTK